MARGRGMLGADGPTSGRMFDQKGAGLHDYEADDGDGEGKAGYDGTRLAHREHGARPSLLTPRFSHPTLLPPQERRREWAAALMARQNTKLNQGEQLVLDGWLERIYSEGGVAESDGQLAARLKRQFVAFERSQWEARAARRKAMADSEGADGRVVVEANESDLDAQAKMEWVRRRRAEAELSLARRRSLASLSDGRYVEDPRLVKERWLKERRQEWEAMVKRRRALAKEERSLIEQRLLSNPALLASLVDAMVDGGTLPESCGGDALGDEDPSFVLDLIKAHLTAARDSAAQLRDRLLEGTQMPVRPLVIERPHAAAPAPSFDA